MDRKTTGEVARELGTSVPRVHRAVDRLGLRPSKSPGGHLRLDATEVRQLTKLLGRVPAVEGFDREETLVLTALGRRPFGLASARAAARAAGVSPTAATKALGNLASLGYVEQVSRQAIEGRVRTISVWKVCWASSAWLTVAPNLAGVAFPESERRLPVATHVPRRLSHLFWDVPNPMAIDLRKRGPTVANRMLTSNDPQALAWAATALRPSDLRRGALFRGVDARTRAMAENLVR